MWDDSSQRNQKLRRIIYELPNSSTELYQKRMSKNYRQDSHKKISQSNQNKTSKKT